MSHNIHQETLNLPSKWDAENIKIVAGDSAALDDKIRELYKDDLTFEEIRVELGLGVGSVNRRVNRMVKNGELERRPIKCHRRQRA